MLDANTKVWFDGKIVELGSSKVGLLTHAMHYGSSAFEGIRAYETSKGAAIFRLREHIERLMYSSKAILMNVDFSVEEIMQGCRDVMNENGLKSAYIRPIVFFDDSSMGLNPAKNKVHVAIIAWSWGKYLADTVRVKISSIRRISELTTIVDAKIGGHYVNSILAGTEAKRMGYDEALLLDHEGNVAEGPGENVFFVKGKVLYTPKAGRILKGITRASVMQIGKDLGYDVVERDINPHELDSFDGAFFTGTAAEVTPIREISGILFDVSVGADVKDKFFEIIAGRDLKYEQWLDYCR